jgi:hypothetical protein
MLPVDSKSNMPSLDRFLREGDKSEGYRDAGTALDALMDDIDVTSEKRLADEQKSQGGDAFFEAPRDQIKRFHDTLQAAFAAKTSKKINNKDILRLTEENIHQHEKNQMENEV